MGSALYFGHPGEHNDEGDTIQAPTLEASAKFPLTASNRQKRSLGHPNVPVFRVLELYTIFLWRVMFSLWKKSFCWAFIVQQLI